MNNNATIPASTDYFFWRLCAWAGPVFLVGSILSWPLLANFFPPPKPSWNAQEVYQFFSDNSLRIRAGEVLTLAFTCFYFVWSVAIWRVMRRLEGPDGVLSMVQLLGGIFTTLIILCANVSWLTAAFRIEGRTPSEAVLLLDQGWMWVDTTLMVTVFQNFAFGLLFLQDKRSKPLIPVWLCWFSFVTGTAFVFDGLIPFFREGPFSWNGLLAYYLDFGIFFNWVAVTCYYIINAVKRLEQESNGQ